MFALCLIVCTEVSEQGVAPEEGESDSKLELSVRSANKWEKAELGDSKRKNKFLRLLGAQRVANDPATSSGDSADQRKGDELD